MNYKQIFTDNGLSQSKASKVIGVSKGYMADILNGKRKNTIEPRLRTYLHNIAMDILNKINKKV